MSQSKDRSEICGIMPRPGRESDFPTSRDWADVDCQAEGCSYNRCLKCVVPSRFQIGPDGRCTGFTIASLQNDKPMRPLDGD